jgi:lysozyme
MHPIAKTLAPRLLAATLALSAAGATFLAKHEGEVRRVYLDPVGIPTSCVGHTRTARLVDVGKPLSAAVCARLLQEDTRVAQAGVGRLVKQPVTQEQYDALVSFVFNVGEGAFSKSTLLRKFNAGDCQGAADQFPRWNQARGRALPGLVTRRAEERALFLQGCP